MRIRPAASFCFFAGPASGTLAGMSLLKKILVIAVLGIIAYCFWPRTSSLAGYNAKEMADLQVLSWQQARIKNWLGHGATMYQVFEGQYHFPPLTAVKLALDQTRAVQDFRTGATDEDKERAKGPLGDVYATLKDKTGSFTGTAEQAAAQEVQLWQALAEPANADAAVKFQSGLLAQVHGGDPARYLPSARLFVQAFSQGASQDWTAARTTLANAYADLQKTAAAPSGKE